MNLRPVRNFAWGLVVSQVLACSFLNNSHLEEKLLNLESLKVLEFSNEHKQIEDSISIVRFVPAGIGAYELVDMLKFQEQLRDSQNIYLREIPVNKYKFVDNFPRNDLGCEDDVVEYFFDSNVKINYSVCVLSNQLIERMIDDINKEFLKNSI